MKWGDVLPVLLSILIIILIAIIEKQSKFLAAITATMPLTAALGVWIVHSSSGGDASSVAEFSLGMLIAIIPTMCFILTVWLASRAQIKILPTLVLGYAVWGIGVALIFSIRKFIGA